jgi:spermidine synthase
MIRSKRIRPVKAHLTPELYEQLEMCLEEQGSRVVTMSDYLFEVIEEHVAMKAIRVGKQKTLRRAGHS